MHSKQSTIFSFDDVFNELELDTNRSRMIFDETTHEWKQLNRIYN